MYCYGSWDRAAGWAAIAEHRTALDDDELRDLVDLSAVNELDVLVHADLGADTRAGRGRLVAGWAPACSPRIAAEIVMITAA